MTLRALSNNTLPPADDTTVDGTTIRVAGGRVTTFALDDADAVGVEITGLPTMGNVTVNPDMSLSLVLSGTTHTGPLSFDYAVTHADGRVTSHSAQLSVAAPTQAAGWGLGDKQYMLATDAQGDVVVEHGDNHRKVYVSGSDSALTKADIAALEGLSVDKITGAWLKANPEYGASEGMALDVEAGMALWFEETAWGWREPDTSNWLLFERGYEYEGTGRLIYPHTRGESELNPVHITAWGEGDRPVLHDQVKMYQHAGQNIVFTDLDFRGGMLNYSITNTIFSDTSFSTNGLNVQQVSGFTLHDSEITNVVSPTPDTAYWSGTVAGMFADKTAGLLIEGNLIHHNAWADDYRADGSTEGGMPPNMFSHNIYLQNTTTDVTFRDNMVSQGGSYGAQIRGGGFVEDNVFLDNNAAVNTLGGVYQGAGPIGNYTLFTDNLITSAGHKDIDGFIGGLSLGMTNAGFDTAIVDSIIAHLADPNNPEEIAKKHVTHAALASSTPLTHDGLIVYNWMGSNPRWVAAGSEDRNTENVDPAIADQTTIQIFAAQLLGKPTATITDLVNYMKALPDSPFDDSFSTDQIIAWFQNGFGVAANGDGSQTAHRFIPNDLGDGVRWDNRLNWTNDETPTDGDDVDLGGNWVQFGAATVRVDDLAFGSNGKLQVTSGKLAVDGALSVGQDGGAILINKAGQFWTEGYEDSDRLDIRIDGGRFANTGDMTGTHQIKVTGGQAILGMDDASLHLDAGDTLWIEGSKAKVGFDGTSNGIATLELEDGANLTFVADAQGVSAIREFRSGAFDANGSNVRSGVRLDGDLNVDLSDYAGSAGQLTLIAADAITGTFDTANIHGLSKTLDAAVVVDYATDRVYLDLTAGFGTVTRRTIGTDTVRQQTDSGDLTFVADGSDLSAISAARSVPAGNQADTNVRLDGNLTIDLSNYSGAAAKLLLIKAADISGAFNTTTVHGLSDSLNARLVVNYETDRVLMVVGEGTGKFKTKSVGTDDDAALWADLTAGHALDTGSMALNVFDHSLQTMADIGFL